MLLINKNVLAKISESFCTCPVEKGFLLGSDCSLNHINYCFDLPASDAGLHYYEPNTTVADDAIRCWGKQGVCFCGMVHSHVVNKQDLSENDIEYAKVLYSAYHLPVMWFGIGIVNANDVVFRFYAVSKTNGQIDITLKEYKIDN
jgi:hypothetical protein